MCIRDRPDDRRIRVLPGDRLGLFFKTTVPPVYYGHDSNFNDRANVSRVPGVGDVLRFRSTLTVLFVAAGFVDTDNSKYDRRGGSVAERLACWTQAQKGPGSNRSRDAVG